MKQYLSILAESFDCTEVVQRLSTLFFSTSPDVVMKASGLRFEAIRAIAREQGVEIEDSACRCIDESLLAALADAHVRKLRAYFNNARRHIAELNGEELATFTDFCKTFKNRQSSDSAAQTWSDIDTDAIREQFIQNVHELTSSEEWSCILNDRLYIHEILSLESYNELDSLEYKRRCKVVGKVVHSNLYYEKPLKLQPTCVDIRSVVRRVTLSARYYIYLSKDEDHLHDTFNNFTINRAPAMVA